MCRCGSRVHEDVTRARRSVAFLLTASWALAGCMGSATVEDDRGLGSSASAAAAPIVRGATAEPEDAVVAIRAAATSCGGTPTVACSGVLIAPQVVVTAAHCLAAVPPGAAEVVTGASVFAPTARVAVARASAHPEWRDPANDIAVLILAEPLPPPFAALPSRAMSDEDVGRVARAAGYGEDGEGDAGIRRAGSTRIRRVTATTFDLSADPAMSCRGDSGGPVLLDEDGTRRLIGVTSFGDPACMTSATCTRVDPYVADFLAPTLMRTLASPPAPRPRLAPADDFCTEACAQDEDCPAEMVCVGSPDGTARCGLFGMPPGQFASACDTDAPCDSGLCVPIGGECRCYAPCDDARAASGSCAVSVPARVTVPWWWGLLIAWLTARRGHRRGALHRTGRGERAPARVRRRRRA